MVSRHARALLRLGLLTLLTMKLPCLVYAQAERFIGIILAPAGEQVSESETLFLDRLSAAVVDAGAQVVVLHNASPLLAAHHASLPAVQASDDWTPLPPVLDRLAARLRLDYIALVAYAPAGADSPACAVLVVARGGASASATPQVVVDEEQEWISAAARSVADAIVALIDEVGAPRDAQVEAMVAPAPAEVDTTGGAAEDEVQPAAGEPTASAETAPTAEVAEQPDEGGQDDPLAPARAAWAAGDYARAALLLRDFIEQNGPSAEVLLLRARVRLALQQQEAALADLERAVVLDPELVEAQVWLGRLLAERGLWQRAIEHYQRALAVDPTHREALLGLARVYRDHGHRRQAIELLTDAVKAGQSDPSVFLLLAELYQLEREYEQAEAALLQAAAMSSGEHAASILERLGDLYASRKLHREALNCYLRAAEMSPTRASIVQRRYRDVMAAADSSVYEALVAGRSAFDDYASDGIGEREMVFRRLSEVRAQLEEAMQFVDGLPPPKGLEAEHARRRFVYSLAVEATVAAIAYVDLGDAEMKERARTRYADALREFQALTGDVAEGEQDRD